MATYNLSGAGVTQLPSHMGANVYVLAKKVDCAVDGAPGFGAADVIQLLDIPADTFVWGVGVKVTTVEGGAATIDVGDGTSTAGYHDNLDINALGHTWSTLALTEAAPNTVTGLKAGKLYSAADTIDVITNTAATGVAVFEVRALCVDMGRPAPAAPATDGA